MSYRMRNAQRHALANDHAGRALAERMRGISKSAHYDRERQVVGIVGHRDQPLSIGFDGKGNVAQVVTPLGRVTRYQYDGDKQVAAQLPTGLLIRTQYDEQGRPVRCERSDGETQQLAYDDQGNLRSLRMGPGAGLRLVYGTERRLAQVIERDGGVLSQSYDERGRLAQVTDPLGRQTRFEYNGWSKPSPLDRSGRNSR